MTPQTVTLAGRHYTFVPNRDPKLDGHDNRHLGELRNSRGQFAAWVFEMHSSGRRILLGGPAATRRFSPEETDALAALAV